MCSSSWYCGYREAIIPYLERGLDLLVWALLIKVTEQYYQFVNLNGAPLSFLFYDRST